MPQSTPIMMRRTLCLIAAALVVAGCGPKGPDVQFVEGVVTLDGKPLDGAAVAFVPVDKAGISAAGKTDADGRFRLNATQGKKYGKGTVVGEYVVTVTKTLLAGENRRPAGATRRARPHHADPLRKLDHVAAAGDDREGPQHVRIRPHLAVEIARREGVCSRSPPAPAGGFLSNGTHPQPCMCRIPQSATLRLQVIERPLPM